MQLRRIDDRDVGEIGLGAMPLSHDSRPDEADAIRVVHAALDAGVTLIDTADAYTPSDHGPGHNESLVAKAVQEYGGDTSAVLIATKGGHTRDGADWGLNGRPDYLRTAAEESVRRLGVEAIGLYQHHRPDEDVPYAETMGGLRDLVDAGLVQRVGVSNAGPDQIREARSILGAALVSVQNQFSPVFRSSEPEIALCEELGLAFLPWSPFGGGKAAKDLGTTVPVFGEVAQAHQASPQQVCLAWMLAKSPAIIPIPGASRPQSVRDSVAATALQLADDELARLDQKENTDG
ncbi:MAG TPA: aldo/keto reductase [Nocardioidaceae bacterium]|nr:aldo/keto reductase [Nocardioidaceae bacterium]